MYAFFALIAVSSILISSFAAYAITLRTIPEVEQLRNLLESVAAKGCELVALTAATNCTSETVIQLPPSIGNRRYWVRLREESSRVWIEGALGEIHGESSTNRVYLPKEVSVSGNYSSGYGQAILECRLIDSITSLRLSTWRGKS
jgi:uncharacterized membrane protein